MVVGTAVKASAPSTSQRPDERQPQLASQWQAAAAQQNVDLVDTDCGFEQMVQLMQLLDLPQRERGAMSGSLSWHNRIHDRVVCGGSFQVRSLDASRLLELRVNESHGQRAGSMLGVKKCGHLWRQACQECSIFLGERQYGRRSSPGRGCGRVPVTRGDGSRKFILRIGVGPHGGAA